MNWALLMAGENDQRYRFSVAGKPDLNTMHTSIDMEVTILITQARLMP
jgi:hypothetical protein